MPFSLPPLPRPAVLAGALALAVAALLLTVRQPLTAPLSEKLEIQDLTWVELRDLVARGYTTVIVPSGGIEENGPHLVIGKHDRIVAETSHRIAQTLGRTLVAPVLSYVPQGGYDPPEANLRYPGTIGVPEAVFAGTLDGIARSLKLAGFRLICLVADHGMSRPPQREVAERLSRAWAAEGIRVASIDGYDADATQIAYLKAGGETDATIGQHAGLQDTAELMAAYPQGVMMERWTGRPLLSEATGASGDPAHASPERGRALLAMKVDAAVREIASLRGGDLALRRGAD